MSTLAVIFSYNRAFQLDAVLRSLLFHCHDISESQVKILYKAGSALHRQQYEQLKGEYRKCSNVQFYEETRFKANLINLLMPFKYVLFLVDDNIFVETFRIKDVENLLEIETSAIGVSLRLGLNTTYCYSLDCEQSIPPGYETINRQFLKFVWVDGTADFGYPLEVSSSVYRLDRVLPLLQRIPFQNPNTLEANLDASKAIFRESCPYLLSYESSRTFCAPVNKVQTVALTNRAGCRQQYDAEELAAQFEQGRRLDIAAYVGFHPNACHQEVAIHFVETVAESDMRERDTDMTLPAPTVSVIIPCFKQAHFLTEAVESVVNQLYHNWECIIVNDGSPDQTSQVAQELIARHPDRQIRLLDKTNGGLAEARNAGIASSRGRYILPLDADDALRPDALTHLVEVLDDHADVALAYSDYEMFGARSGIVRTIRDDQVSSVVPRQNGLGYCSLYRREVWSAVGGYNPNMTWGYEDWNFWVGCVEKGVRARKVPESLFLYRVKPDSMYTNAIKHDAELKAQIVLNHPALYDEATRRWAGSVLEGRTGSACSADKLSTTETVSPDIAAVNAHLQRADERFVAGDLVAAKDALLDAITLAPGDPQLILAYGNIILRLGDVEDARREFVKATKLAPDDAAGYLNLAAVLLMLGQIQEAETTVRRALELQPDDADALKLLGRLCFESGRGSEGVTAYTEALRQRPDDVETLLVLGKCAVEAGDRHTAQLTYERVLQIDPNNELARENLDLVKEHLSANAIRPVPASVSHSPLVSVIVPTCNRPTALRAALDSIVAQTYSNVEIIVVNDGDADPQDLVNVYRRQRPVTYVVHDRNRGTGAARNTGLKLARGEYIAYLDDDDRYLPDHIAVLTTALNAHPDHVAAYALATEVTQIERNGQRESLRRQVTYNRPFDRHQMLVANYIPNLCLMHRRSACEKIGGHDEDLVMLEDWDFLIRLSRIGEFVYIPKVTAEYCVAVGSGHRNRLDEHAITATRAIYERYSAHAVPPVRQAQQAYLERLGAVVRHPDRVSQASVRSEEVAPLIHQAEQHIAGGDLAEAQQCLSQALQILPDEPQLIVALGNVLLRLGDVDAARGEFTKATVLHPQYVQAHADLATVLLHLGRAEEAETAARKAIELDPTNLSALKVLARVCLDTERYQEAVQAYATILKYAPDDVETLILVGNCCAETGRFEQARAFYRKVLVLEPGNAIAAENMAEADRLASTADGATPGPVAPATSEGYPSVSIVIVTYNSAATIRACLDSVLGEARPATDLIVVDNVSTDETRSILREYQGRITTILNSDNVGFSAACNQGICALSGEYIVLLNPDTVVTSGWLDRMIAHFEPGVGAVGPVSDYAAALQNIDRNLPDGAPKRMGLGEVSDLLARVNSGKGVETKLLIGFCLMVPRRVLDEVGLLDEALFLGNEDLDLSWRLHLKGYTLLVATDTFVHHRGQVSFKSEAEAKTSRLVQESTDRLYAKLEAHYGSGNVPSPMELWGIDWFKPSPSAPCTLHPTPSPLTSIIILTHNGLEHTTKCLASIEACTPEPHELIIVDNASTDGTLDYLRGYMAAHDNVRAIANRTNRGFAAGNNQGLALARGEYVLLLNNDTIVTEGWLTRMLRIFRTHPDVGIVGPVSNYVSGPQLVRDASYASREELDAFAAQWATDHAGQGREATRVVGFCLLMRKEVVARIGGLDERFGSGNFEDDDFCIRAFQVGFRARIALDVFIHHAGSQTFKAAKIDYRQSLMRNWKLFKRKWGIPADSPYEKGYRFPPQPLPESCLTIPLPDVGADCRCEGDGRWWQEPVPPVGRRQNGDPVVRRPGARVGMVEAPAGRM